ncbi:MAG: CDP-alcohol phosphatidyltransferase family protein [Acidimicrobiales bacterium]
MAQRPPIRRPDSSRAFVDQALAELALSRFSPIGLGRFLWRNSVRSGEQALAHPRGYLELTLMGLGLAALGHRLAAVLTWSLGITHLGLLGEDDIALGWPNRLSLLRANLPALVAADAPILSPLALATDYLDGRLARRGHETAFGAYADGLADIIFWSWFLEHNEPSALLRAVALSLWVGPATLIAVAYFKGGRSRDYPRPRAFRVLSVSCQLLVGARAINRRRAAVTPMVSHCQLLFPPADLQPQPNSAVIGAS